MNMLLKWAPGKPGARASTFQRLGAVAGVEAVHPPAGVREVDAPSATKAEL
ncbi:MAG: hypothetical protein WKF75_11175 [Singulisphaera sp.]